MTAQQPHPAPPPLYGTPLLVAGLATSAGTFMVALDATIANVSLTTITGDLGVTATQGSWIVTSYGVANAISMLLTGWAAKRVGQVRLYVLAVLCFTLASLLCSMSTSLAMLVLFRVLQGLSAGPMFSLAMALNMQCYPPHKASQAIAAQVVIAMAAPAMGPIIGGWLTEHFSWPSIFFVNVPFGLMGAFLAWQVLRDRESPRVREPVDVVGLVLLVIWVAALQTTLEQGREMDWFDSVEVRVLAITALVSFAFFLVWEWFDAHPVVDMSMFRYRNFVVGLVTNSLGNLLYFGTMVLVPIWLSKTLHYTASWAGWVVAPVGLVALLLNSFAGKMLARFQARFLVMGACLVFAGVSLVRSGFNNEISAQYMMWLHAVQGVGMAFFFMPLIVTMLSGIPQARLATATGMANFVRFTAGSLGTSLAVSLWDHRASFHHARLTEHVHAYQAGVPGSESVPALYQIEQEIVRQAETMAANDYFYLSAFLFLGLIAVIGLARTPNVPAPSRVAAPVEGSAH